MVEQKRYECRIIISLFLMTMWFPCYSQQKQTGYYEISGVNGESSIYINGMGYYDYMNEKKWENKNDFRLFDEDTVKISDSNAYIGLLKDHKNIGCLCYASNSKEATIKESLDLLCQVNLNAKKIDIGGIHVKERIKGSEEYYDTLSYVLSNYPPKRDLSDWKINGIFLEVTSHNDKTILYDVLFETDTCLISTDIPFFLKREEHTFCSKIPDNPIMFVHIFWQVFDENKNVPNELDIEKPIFHYSIIMER